MCISLTIQIERKVEIVRTPWEGDEVEERRKECEEEGW